VGDGCRQRESSSKELCASQVCRKIPIAEPKPGWQPVSLSLFKAAKRFILEPPASNRIESFGQRISDRVNVGANVQSPNFGVITYIDDDVDSFFWNDLYQTA